MFWMLVTFLIVLGILTRYAWPVILRSLEKRAAFIDSGVENAEKALQKLNDAGQQAQKILEKAYQQQMNILQEAGQLKEEIIAEARKAAEEEARKVMKNAERSIERAEREAELQRRKQVRDLALGIAGKVLRKDLSREGAQAELIDRLLEEMDAKS